jgi:hypothetical protein
VVASIFLTAAVQNIAAPRLKRVWQELEYRIDVCLEARIIAAVNHIDAPMLTRVWQELEYRIDMCRVTRGAHIEHL